MVKSARDRMWFRILVGSYEHNLLCLSLMLTEAQPVFQPVFHFEAHSLSIKSIDVAKRYLVTGSNDEHIRIYDLQKRKELGTLLSHQGTVTTLRFSDEHSASEIQESSEKSGKWLLSGSEDGKIIIWRTKDWEIFGTLKGHQDRINDLDIHPTGRVAISVSKDNTIRLWNLMTCKKAAILKVKGRDSLGQECQFVRWTKSGNHFIVGLMNKIFVYEAKDAKIHKQFGFKTTLMCMDVVTFEGAEWLVTGHSNGVLEFYDSKILVETEEEPRPVFSLRGHTNRIKDFSLYKVGTVPFLVSVSSDGKIVVWDLSESVRDQIAVYDTGERLNCVAVCPEAIEKAESMKRRYDPNEINDYSESEYETDGEEMRKVFNKASKKKRSKSSKSKVSITRE
ncbi:WD40 repeat-like protein [Yamadazyma tenuis ATCC 10573]|uniref:WD40 repeat-like protein n=1 Tax=Candida tenuis (strain ATCC 10573 / BCRC 21748 / CBS 615 / JCM 9827 / NBRC 10315 / NRRL Y-1498 / VKM Y-70) TaxID=590646 RepID=G3B2P6_CANTC|nr:WD40 repeat-like protein [Yamadazyma tenuis ATCC 10573]EGV64726.1 WD40 repeat-like protein [Yamadazyma tenuis ATCC 10573]